MLLCMLCVFRWEFLFLSIDIFVIWRTEGSLLYQSLTFNLMFTAWCTSTCHEKHEHLHSKNIIRNKWDKNERITDQFDSSVTFWGFSCLYSNILLTPWSYKCAVSGFCDLSFHPCVCTARFYMRSQLSSPQWTFSITVREYILNFVSIGIHGS